MWVEGAASQNRHSRGLAPRGLTKALGWNNCFSRHACSLPYPGHRAAGLASTSVNQMRCLFSEEVKQTAWECFTVSFDFQVTPYSGTWYNLQQLLPFRTSENKTGHLGSLTFGHEAPVKLSI